MLHMMNDYRNTVGTGECDECLNEPRLVFELVSQVPVLSYIIINLYPLFPAINH